MSNEQTPVTEKNDVIADHFDELRQIELEGYELAVKKARNALFWVAALIMFWELYASYRQTGTFELEVTLFAAFVSGIFLLLAFWTKTKPYTALISGIIAFILYKLLVVGVNGYLEGGEGILKGLMSGIIFTIFIFVQLFRPLKDAKELQKAKEENRQK
jgi:peptidoglycan/LPS O-acetylase OafA/YrhL